MMPGLIATMHVSSRRSGESEASCQEYVDYFNQARPHQRINQAVPTAAEMRADPCQSSRTIVSKQVLGGLHHDYRFAA